MEDSASLSWAYVSRGRVMGAYFTATLNHCC